jgi:5-carboxymethyl-2-hydroxymuconate isomerase
MPHFILEYSPNVANHVAPEKLVETVRRAAVETGLFPLGGIRVRAYRADCYTMADGDPSHAFVALQLCLLEGRSEEARKKAGAHIFKALEAVLAPAYAAGPLALSFDMREILEAFSFKSNTVHAALTAKAKAVA